MPLHQNGHRRKIISHISDECDSLIEVFLFHRSERFGLLGRRKCGGRDQNKQGHEVPRFCFPHPSPPSSLWIFHFGLSRCTTFTRYPAFFRPLVTSSPIIPERSLLPLHPKALRR